MHAIRLVNLACAAAAVVALSGCAQMQSGLQSFQAMVNPPPPAPVVFSQEALPAAVQVPRGHRVSLETVGMGELTQSCQRDAATGAFAWRIVTVKATLRSRSGEPLVAYDGPPAVFAHDDGSVIRATAVATAPSSSGNLPFQLFAAGRSDKLGAMMGVTYIQRVANSGGVVAKPCNAQALNNRETLPFQADYIFYRSL